MNHGNQAMKIPSGRFSLAEEQEILSSKDIYVYANMLHSCEEKIKQISVTKNLDQLEYNSLFNSHCGQFEKLYTNGLRKRFRMKSYNDQVKEFSMPVGEIYHPYNPYLQKYHGAYLRTYQQF